MTDTLRSMALLAIAAVLLAGCGSAEDRITEAVPVGKEVEAPKAALDKALDALPAERKKEIDALYRAQLKLRAVECSAGYTPSTFASAQTIREEIGNAECFTAADAKLRHWIGMRRAALLAVMPPLRPVPAQPAAMLVATDRIMDAAFADEAGVAVLASLNRYQLVDLANGASLRIGEYAGGVLSLSANARLLAIGANNEARLHDADTGELLATFEDARQGRVHWLHDKGLVFANADGKLTFFDSKSGTESIVPMETPMLAAAIPAPDKPDAFVLLGSARAGTLQLTCNDRACTPELTQEAKLTGGRSWATNVAVAGNHAYYTSGQELNRVHLGTLHSQAVPFAPMRLSQVIPTRNPDQLILKAGGSSGIAGLYLYSIANKTLARIDGERLLSTRITYAPTLGGNVAIDGSKLVRVDEFPAEPPQALASVLSSMEFEVQAAKLEMFDRLQALQAAREATAAARHSSWPASPGARDSGGSSRSFAAGEAGLAEAVRAGVLRLGNAGDVNAWKRSYASKTGKSLGSDFDDRVRSMAIYVITGDLVIPTGLSGAHAVVFVLNGGAPHPRGSPGHSLILDVKSGSCGGPVCGMVLR